jgi:hypothetical protein
MTHLRAFAIGIAALAASGCGEGSVEIGFTAADAEELVRDFGRRALAGDEAGVRVLCAVPFQYKSRTWVEAKTLEGNLPAMLRDMEPELRDAEHIEVFSFSDLLAGRWPRGRELLPSEREEEARRLGLGPGTFLARVGAPRRAGLQLRLVPEGMRRLVVTAVF